MPRGPVMIGTAGWSIPRALTADFPGEGSHLERYAKVMRCAEINSSFYRDHSFATYQKWAAATPRDFRFAVKVPQLITHEQQLRRARGPLRELLENVAGLGRKLGPLLIQLPPSLSFDARVARTFFTVLREEYAGAVVCEPRHASWFEIKAEAMLDAYRIGRVATDPTRMHAAHTPGAYGGIAYYRLHGSPRKYWSRYEPARIQAWANEIEGLAKRQAVWCIFDNTASGAALVNALEIASLLQSGARGP